MSDVYRTPRRRRWPIVLLVLLIVLGGLWAGVWYYGAGVAERTVTAWMAREAQAGRVYTCTSQTIGGFPFGVKVRCADVGAELKSSQPPVALKAKDMLVSASIWQPTVLTTEFKGPLTIAEPGQPVTISANWQHARTKARGLPASPESVSINIDQLLVARAAGGDNLFKADIVGLDGRLVSGTVQSN